MRKSYRKNLKNGDTSHNHPVHLTSSRGTYFGRFWAIKVLGISRDPFAFCQVQETNEKRV